MSDVENLAHLYDCLLQNDESIRFPAQNQLLEFRKTNLVGFIETNLEIIKNIESFSPSVLHSALLYTRLSFVKATKAKRSNDDTKQYLFIPLELANGFLPVIFNLLTNSDISYLTAQLLGQISCYLLSFEPENQIISQICQELPNKEVSIPCCSVIEYVFLEIEVSPPLQSIVLSTVTPLLSDDNFPNEIKSNLISVINSMILCLPNFLSSPSEAQEFAQSMFSLISTDPLKKSSYDFWDSAAKYFPSIFEFIPDICETSFNDIQSILNKNDQDEDDMKIIISILQLWSTLGDQTINEKEEEKPDEKSTLTSLLSSSVSAFFPLFLNIYQNINDPDSLDSIEHDIHAAAGDSILSITCAVPENSIPILLEFVEQAMANLENSPSPTLKETVLFSFSAVIDAYEADNNEENENNATIQNIAIQCIQLVSQCIAESSEPDPSIYVISRSLKLLLSIVQSYPELYDYSEFMDFLMSCIQNIHNPFIEESKELLDEIILLPNFKGNSDSIFESLLSFDNVPSLIVARDILKKNLSSEFALNYLPRLIALAEIYLKNEGNGTEGEERAEVNTQACIVLLPFIIQMIVLLIDHLKEESIPFMRVLSEMMQFAYDQYKHPEALKAICSIARITNQNVPNAVNIVIMQLNNSILSEDSTNEIELPSYEMRLTAITSISLYLSFCKIEDYFHELMRILLRLLESQQEQTDVKIIDSSLKIEVIEALNSLHFHFPSLMKPFFEKLMAVYGAALESVPAIRFHEEDEKTAVQMNYAILEGVKLLLMNEPEDSAPTIMQMAIAAIQSAIESPCINPQCVSELVDLLKVLMGLTPDETKNYISTDEDLNQLLGEAKEQGDEELANSIDGLLSMMS